MDLPTPAGPITSWQHRGMVYVACGSRRPKIRLDEKPIIVDGMKHRCYKQVYKTVVPGILFTFYYFFVLVGDSRPPAKAGVSEQES